MAKHDVALRVEYVPIGSLRPYPNNARTHSKKQIQQIASSIREFGFTNPILADADGMIVAGVGRFSAAQLLGMSEVPTVRVGHLSPQQKRAYILADNRLAEKAGWDPEILKIEFEILSKEDLEFDLEITGFESAEIDLILDGPSIEETLDPANAVPAVGTTAISRLGDLWNLSNHRLLCADARDRAACARLFGSDQARLVFADPPYNVPIQGHVGGLGSIKHREFAMASGEMTPAEFGGFLRAAFQNAVEISIDGALHYICMDWPHILILLGALENLCVWNKTNGGMGSFYRSKHELIAVYKVGTAAHTNNIDLGRNGRYRTNVWDYAGVNTFARDRLKTLAMHPTVKPVTLVADAIKDCSNRKDIVFDPFIGSGTTIVAAEKTGRFARGIEIDPLFVDVAIRRWQDMTGAWRFTRLVACISMMSRDSVAPPSTPSCRSRTSMKNDKSQRPSYEIGRGRPPVHSRFRPGQSGNPKGRPKGRLSQAAMLKRILNEKAVVREGGRTRTMTKYECVYYVLVLNAMKGDTKAFKALVEIIKEEPCALDVPPILNLVFANELPEDPTPQDGRGNRHERNK